MSPRGVRLIATDLDDTLLGVDKTVSSRTRAALDAARAAGIHVVPVTARAPVGLRTIAAGAGFAEWALCGNGGYGVHLGTGEVLFQTSLAADTQRAVVEALNARVPGLLYASVRDAGDVFIAQEGYAALVDPADHSRAPDSLGGVSLGDVIDSPGVKLVIRHPELAPRVVFDELAALQLTGFEATLSGAPFVEIMAAGVTKATGLEILCARLDVAASEVVAFGDALNDVAMLRWAGRGIAMANALPIVKEAADEIAGHHDQDGVAEVIERLLGA